VLETPENLRTEDLGARLRAVRELAGAGQRDVAKAAGLSRRDLQAAERGAKRLSHDELTAVAVALGIDADVFATSDDALAGADSGATAEPVVGSTGPAADVTNAPASTRRPERRRDHGTRAGVEQSWRTVRDEMTDVLTSCARLLSAGAGDDVRRLLENLDHDLNTLRTQGTFRSHLADHERALAHVRGTGRIVTPTVSAAATRTR
jgi:DNA-binding XRE family transcriptional regulator